MTATPVGVRDGWDVDVVFQPVLTLPDREVVGVEALVRGAPGTPWNSADDLFDEARRRGDVTGLDAAARRTALRDATRVFADRNAAGDLLVFVNVEAVSVEDVMADVTPDLVDDLRTSGCRLVLEVTERDLRPNLPQLLVLRAWAARAGVGFALDDVGAEPGSAGLISLLEPDVVKVDLELVQHAPDVETARVVNAVQAEASRTGARVVVEGIETDEHEQMALAMGADLAQGFRFGRPTAPSSVRVDHDVDAPPPTRRPDQPVAFTPWQLLDRPNLRRSAKPLLVAMSRFIEDQAARAHGDSLLISAFQRYDHLTPSTLRRYEALAPSTFLTVVLGTGVSRAPAPGVVGASIATGDPLGTEWTATYSDPFHAVALLAREVPTPDDVADRDRVFDYVVTYDRRLVLEAQRLMLGRLESEHEDDVPLPTIWGPPRPADRSA